MGDRLESLGLDPLHGIEWDVLKRIDTVLQRLAEMSGTRGENSKSQIGHDQPSGQEVLRRRTDALFGPAPEGRNARIMMTLGSEAADDPGVIRSHGSSGADCFRINCARDKRETWKRIIDQIRREGDTGKRSLIFMDLGGSKLRVSSCARGKEGILLDKGATLRISRKLPSFSFQEELTYPEITVSDPSGLSEVLPGHKLWFDDGKIGGIVRKVDADALEVEITFTRKGGRKLRLDRGLNLPDTRLRLPALTEKDRDDMPFAAREADFLALSFIRTPSDLDEFQAALPEVTDKLPTIVIKIETREALRQLPRVMLAGMRQERVAMLIARGDLAVECGIVEMPRIQKEVLHHCAAAGLPLFWATGVLERMSRTGEPTRAEITDADQAAHAQCIMLNKGPRSLDTLRFLVNLLARGNETT
jgi:pyruvate kinase